MVSLGDPQVRVGPQLLSSYRLPGDVSVADWGRPVEQQSLSKLRCGFHARLYSTSCGRNLCI